MEQAALSEEQMAAEQAALSEEQMAAEQAALDWWRERRKAMADFFNAPAE